MKAKVVSIDYWETLFVHVGNPSFRKNVRKECYDKHLVALGLNELANVSNSFFDVIDKEVKLTWQTGISPKRDDLIKHAARYYGQSVSIATLEKLLDATYELYTKQLLPHPVEGAIDFIHEVASQWPLYIISDTYTIVGNVLDRVLLEYDLLRYFKGRLYSDQLGKKKPHPISIQHIIEQETITAEDIVHIGDLEETDGELARCTGCRCILVNPQIGRDFIQAAPNDRIIARCSSLYEAKEILIAIR